MHRIVKLVVVNGARIEYIYKESIPVVKTILNIIFLLLAILPLLPNCTAHAQETSTVNSDSIATALYTAIVLWASFGSW